MTESLFAALAPRPLPDRLRPASFAEVVGQDHLLRPGAPLGRMIATRQLSSMILWGPPGTGKTTLALLLAKHGGMEVEKLHAVRHGLPELRKALEAAQERRRAGRSTVLFLDEIHRWNKSQQDGLLAGVEDGTITLIGATTENPSFELNGALLSRCKVFTLNRFSAEELDQLANRAEAHMGRGLPITDDARAVLIGMADGDGRYLLNLCEDLFALPDGALIDAAGLGEVLQKRAPAYDKSTDGHYSFLSALQKSVRGSDVQAALYYMARMLKGGEPVKNIFRRLTVMATEEIGLADPNAVQHTVACAQAYERVGDPEGWQALAQAVAYLATAPKSNATYLALHAALELAEQTGSLPPPKHIVNAPTKLMKEMGLKDGYAYDHDFPHAFSGQEFFPAGLDGANRPELYQPNERANEREVLKRMQFWDGLRAQRRG